MLFSSEAKVGQDTGKLPWFCVVGRWATFHITICIKRCLWQSGEESVGLQNRSYLCFPLYLSCLFLSCSQIWEAVYFVNSPPETVFHEIFLWPCLFRTGFHWFWAAMFLLIDCHNYWGGIKGFCLLGVDCRLWNILVFMFGLFDTTNCIVDTFSWILPTKKWNNAKFPQATYFLVLFIWRNSEFSEFDFYCCYESAFRASIQDFDLIVFIVWTENTWFLHYEVKLRNCNCEIRNEIQTNHLDSK